MSSTCLYAAAWKTTVGRCWANTSRIRSPSLQSARTAASTEGWTWRSSSSSRWMRKRFSSAWSIRISRRGATRAIWRQSSEPIEPPAPVTMTVSPLRYAPTRSSSIRTGSRPRTSSTCTSRTWRTTVPRPGLQQLEDRRQRADRDPAAAALAHDPRAQRARRRRDRDGQLVGLGLVEDPPELLGPARARGRPRRGCPRLSGSSSTKPTGSMSSCGLRSISRRTSRPPSPAPTISTRRAPLRGADAAQRPLVGDARDEPRPADEARA